MPEAPAGQQTTGAAASQNGSTPQAEPFAGLTHEQVLALTFERNRELVADLIPAGSPGSIVGVPEVGKSWLAQAIAVGVARGEGTILGRQVATEGPVGYFWQDDSTREEAERIQHYARVRETPTELPVRWFLNEGLELPRDLARMRATIDEHGLILCIVDSFYNVAAGDLKDRDAGKIVAQIKNEVCDPTGCTVLTVDHMPWATEQNRGRLRAYGDVFKGAAWRFGIYIDADNDKIYVEARGNNIRGFKKTLAVWDDDQLELRLLDPHEVPDAAYADRILAHLAAFPWTTSEDLLSDVEGKSAKLREARTELEDQGLIVSARSSSLGRPGKGLRWNLASQATLTPPRTRDEEHEHNLSHIRDEETGE